MLTMATSNDCYIALSATYLHSARNHARLLTGHDTASNQRLCLPSGMSGSSLFCPGCLFSVKLRRTLAAYTCLGECRQECSLTTQLCSIWTSSFKHLVLTGSSLGGDRDLGLVHTGMSATQGQQPSEASYVCRVQWQDTGLSMIGISQQQYPLAYVSNACIAGCGTTYACKDRQLSSTSYHACCLCPSHAIELWLYYMTAGQKVTCEASVRAVTRMLMAVLE